MACKRNTNEPCYGECCRPPLEKKVARILDDLIETPTTMAFLEQKAAEIINAVRLHDKGTQSLYMTLPRDYRMEPRFTTDTRIDT